MKKLCLMCLGLLLCLPMLSAQTPMEVSYSPGKAPDVRDLMQLLNITQLSLSVNGSLVGKKAELRCYTCRGDQIDTLTIPLPRSLTSDSLQIQVLSYPLASDSVKLQIVAEGYFRWIGVFVVPNTQHILLETALDQTPTNDIPLFAYTTGLPVRMEFNGQMQAGVNYCQLRDKKLHPAQWASELNVSNYLYVVLHLIE